MSDPTARCSPVIPGNPTGMRRTVLTLLLSGATMLGAAACGDDGPPDTTGDSVTENQQTQSPAPVPTE